MSWLHILLFLHVGAAVVGLGPTYAFAFIGNAIEKHPQIAHPAAELMHKMERGLVLPLALSLPVTGVAMILVAGINLTTNLWLVAGILLYLVAISLALFVLLPNTAKLVAATAGGPPQGSPPAGAPAGPPPHIARLANQNRVAGMINGLLVVVIVFLMVVKPGT
jgi:uncharacterized membrane protein